MRREPKRHSPHATRVQEVQSSTDKHLGIGPTTRQARSMRGLPFQAETSPYCQRSSWVVVAEMSGDPCGDLPCNTDRRGIDVDPAKACLAKGRAGTAVCMALHTFAVANANARTEFIESNSMCAFGAATGSPTRNLDRREPILHCHSCRISGAPLDSNCRQHPFERLRHRTNFHPMGGAACRRAPRNFGQAAIRCRRRQVLERGNRTPGGSEAPNTHVNSFGLFTVRLS